MTDRKLWILLVIVLMISSSTIIPFNHPMVGIDPPENRDVDTSTLDQNKDLKSADSKRIVDEKNIGTSGSISHHTVDRKGSDITRPPSPHSPKRSGSSTLASDNTRSLDEILQKEDYQNHETIRIDSDVEFSEMAGEEGWSGDGSKDQPYLLEGYDINGENKGYGIYIGNVSHHFIIRESHLHSAEGNSHLYYRDSGLYLYNTTNGVVKNNTISNNRYGVYLQDSMNNSVKDNIILENTGPGIFLLDADNNSIKENSIQDEEEPTEEEEDHSDSVLVKFKSSELPATSNLNLKENHLRDELRCLTDTIDASIDRVFPFIYGGKLSLEEGIDPSTAVKVLSDHPMVEYAELDKKVQLMKEPNDPGYDSLWGMQNIDAPGAWEVSSGKKRVVVAVLDTGIDYTHPDLKENMWEDQYGHHGYNFVNDSHHPMDDYGHGTHVAGTVGAVGNNSLGVAGVNWDVSLMSLKFIDQTGSGTISDAISSLEYVLEKKKEGVNIVATSNSWGGSEKSRFLSEAIERHRDEDILFIAAAGNSNRNVEEEPSFPASYELTNIISVGATGKEDNRTSFSNYGANSVHVGAPGEDINSTSLDERYEYASGTSMATPHVSGLAALIASYDDSYNHNNIKNIIISSVDKFDDLEDKTLTSGRINATRAVTKTPDEGIHFWIHAPGNRSHREVLTESNIMVSLNDGIDPVLGANISVEFSTGEKTKYLSDDGTGLDQIKDDGYYSGHWLPEVHGEIELTFTAKVGGWQKQKTVNVTVGKEAGMSLWCSNDNLLYKNDLSDNPYGMSLYLSHGNVIRGNNLSGNDHGILLERSNSTQLYQNKIEDVFDGIILLESYHNVFSENHISECIYGIHIQGGNNHTIDSNRLIDNYIGVFSSSSKYGRYQGNNLSENSYGIDIYLSNNNTINENTGYNNSIFLSIWSSKNDVVLNNMGLENDYSIYLAFTLNSTLRNNSMKGSGLMITGSKIEYWDSHSIGISNIVNDDPIYYWTGRTDEIVPQDAGQVILVNCTEVTVKDQILERASVGIISAFSKGNMITNNTVSENFIGIYSYLSNHDEIMSNSVFRNEDNGIRVFSSDNTFLFDNSVLNGSYAIAILNSERNTLKKNRMENTGILLDGVELEYWNTHSIDTSNTINSAQVHYWKNETGGTVPEDAGQVILANSTGVSITGQNLSGLGDAVTMGFSQNNTLRNVSISNNIWGVYLRESNDNLLKSIFSVNNTQGITMQHSNRNQISHSTFSNDTYGILMAESRSNKIYMNDFSEIRRAIQLIFNSKQNIIYHNNFFESELEPGRDGGYDNQWYSDYPDGGNYWLEYESDDIYSGPGQNESGSDGIADTPYEGNGFVDQYPLMSPIKPMDIKMRHPKNDTYVNRDELTVRWCSEGGIGIRNYRIRLEGREWVDVGNATQYVLTGLEDGRTVVQVEATDNTGRTRNDTVVFTVDTVSPSVKINEPEDRSVFHQDEVMVRWDGKGEISAIDYYEIRIDGEKWIRVGDENEYIFEDLRNGKYTVEVRAVDEAGNTAVEEVTLFVYVYNLYVVVPLTVLTTILLSYGLWGIVKTAKAKAKAKARAKKEEGSVKNYDHTDQDDFSEYKLSR
ncbi:MAG: NosD domain-containing protein [Candidatus Saliniplasma sp.]